MFHCSVNLTFLGFFKYFNFFVDSAEHALRTLGINPTNFRLSIVLPVGISFYTFQSLSYTIDVYRRRIGPTARFWDFALFVAYFPPMVAGPIERARHLLPQLTRPRRIRLIQTMDGSCSDCLQASLQKVAIADGIMHPSNRFRFSLFDGSTCFSGPTSPLPPSFLRFKYSVTFPVTRTLRAGSASCLESN